MVKAAACDAEDMGSSPIYLPTRPMGDSLSLRPPGDVPDCVPAMERWLSGLKRSLAKRESLDTTEGSNPSLSSIDRLRSTRKIAQSVRVRV